MTFKKVNEEDWLEEARRAFQQTFGKKDSEGPMTFSQMEDVAVQEGNRLARWLLEKKLGSDCAHQLESGEAPCPSPIRERRRASWRRP